MLYINTLARLESAAMNATQELVNAWVKPAKNTESNSPKSLCASISVDKDRPYDPAPCDGPNSVLFVLKVDFNLRLNHAGLPGSLTAVDR